jgi:predicted esterase
MEKFTTSLEIPITYIHLSHGENKPLLVFVHGFADSAQAFLRRAYPEVTGAYEILAINGPFPVPQKKGDEWKHAFAWYFADFAKGTTYIAPQVAVKAVEDLLKNLNLEKRQKMLIAFSQGGFFVPHLLPKLQNVKHVVTIGAAYRTEDYADSLTMPLDALHGSEDEVIALSRAKESFEVLKIKNPNGEFVEFSGMKHSMNDGARLWLKQKINKVLG